MLRKLYFVVLRFASLTLFTERVFIRERKSTFVFIEGSTGVCAFHARALTPLLKNMEKRNAFWKQCFLFRKEERRGENRGVKYPWTYMYIDKPPKITLKRERTV